MPFHLSGPATDRHPTPTRRRPAASLVLAAMALLAGCNSRNIEGVDAAATPVPATTTGQVPAQPASGAMRAGTAYNIGMQNAATGDTVAITVFEPTRLTGGQTYPLVLYSHGFGGSRQKSTSSVDPGVAILDPRIVETLLADGYGVITISERGSDESTGTIRVMDPDYEGKDLVGVLDWAEANLAWLRYGPGIDGQPDNLVVGSVGGSYGGMYQFLLNNIDAKRRLDAMVPQYAPHDLRYSLFPNGAVKSGWDTLLFEQGNTAGPKKGNIDPFIFNYFAKALSTNTLGADGQDFFYYHSNAYFCNARPVAGNGTVNGTTGTENSGTRVAPERLPVPAGRSNVLLFQGMRDTLFNFNEAYANYQCYRQGGGDVRLLSYQAGHNSLKLVPDPGQAAYQQPDNDMDTRCGSVDSLKATMAFFAQYLKNEPGAADKVIPTRPCLSLAKNDGILVDGVTTGRAGRMAMVPATNVVAGGPLDAPVAVDLGMTATAGDVVAGIPHVELTVTKVAAATPGEPILLVGLGQTRNGAPGVYDLLDNQLTPLRGTGRFDVDLVGVAERLKAGEKLYLLVYGQHDQFHFGGTVNAGSPAAVPVTVGGTAWVPWLGNVPAMAATP